MFGLFKWRHDSMDDLTIEEDNYFTIVHQTMNICPHCGKSDGLEEHYKDEFVYKEYVYFLIFFRKLHKKQRYIKYVYRCKFCKRESGPRQKKARPRGGIME
jgi:hypothetical protein